MYVNHWCLCPISRRQRGVGFFDFQNVSNFVFLCNFRLFLFQLYVLMSVLFCKHLALLKENYSHFISISVDITNVDILEFSDINTFHCAVKRSILGILKQRDMLCSLLFLIHRTCKILLSRHGGWNVKLPKNQWMLIVYASVFVIIMSCSNDVTFKIWNLRKTLWSILYIL